MPFGIDPAVLASGLTAGGLAVGVVTHGVIGYRARTRAAEIKADALRDAADAIAKAIMGKHGDVFARQKDLVAACSTSSEHIAAMGANIARIQQELQQYGKVLNDLERLVHDGRVHGQDRWVVRGDVDPAVARVAAARYTPPDGTPQLSTLADAPGGAPVSPAALNPTAATAVLPRMGGDGRPVVIPGQKSMFQVDPNAAARQRQNIIDAAAAKVRATIDDAGNYDLAPLWDYLHRLLPADNVFLWSGYIVDGVARGTWYDAILPDAEKALGIKLPTRIEELFPGYKNSNEYVRSLKLTHHPRH